MSLNARIPVSYQNLPRKEQQAIADIITEEVVRLVDQNSYEMLDMFLKLMCIKLHDHFNFTEDELILFVGNVKNALRWNKRLIDEGTQKLTINQRISEIFSDRKYPQDWVDKLFKPDDGGRNEQNIGIRKRFN